ncbi:hypothetical protein ZIOFF_053871 [Zingiber officinale]|uniref:Uncharacterized protein n=1 Tax=Zingiber officinale TaxID=94328 RepID=A0A8J5FCX0_ZINOF|nr:hypothetical protein ZIOFF_053871 [Zingiber officinale]
MREEKIPELLLPFELAANLASPVKVPVDSPERKVLESEEKKERITEHPHGERKRLRRFLADTFSRSVQLEEDKRVPVIIHGRLVEVQGEASPESGSKKATAKKSVTIKEKREEIQVEVLKKTAPSKREAKESHPPAKLSKAISDINQRAMDFIEKRKRQLLGRSLTVLNNPKDQSST